MNLARNLQIFFWSNPPIPKQFIFIATLLLFMFSAETRAQFGPRFKFSTGYSSYLLEVGSKVTPVYASGITPQINLWQPRANFSIAFATPLALGVHFRTKVLGRMFFFSDIPLMGELNYGHLATKDFRKWWGVFAGGGYTFQSTGTRWQYGAVLSGGFRFFLFKQSFTLRYARFFSEYASGDFFSHRLTLEITIGRWVKGVHFKNKLGKFEKPFQ